MSKKKVKKANAPAKAKAKPVVKKKAAKAPAKAKKKPVAKKAKPDVKKAKAKVAPKAKAKPAAKKAVAKKAVKPAKEAPKKAAPAKVVKAVKAETKKETIAPVASKPTIPPPVRQAEPRQLPPRRHEPARHMTPKTTTEPGKTRYSDKELEEFRALIIKKLEDARKELGTLQAQLTAANEHGTDDTASTFKVLEDGSDSLAKEEAGQLAGRQKKFIEQLENALIRIENKTYGICRVTQKLIPKERLRAVPHTTQSIEAKLNQYRD